MASYLTQQTLVDTGKTTIIKITERFDSSNDRYFAAVVPSTLRFANTSQTCIVSVEKIQYSTGFANGSMKLYWDSGSNPVDIVNLGKSQSGHFDAYIINNSTAPLGGNINLQVYNTQANDSYTIIVHLNKESGFANAYIGYNDSSYKP